MNHLVPLRFFNVLLLLVLLVTSSCNKESHKMVTPVEISLNDSYTGPKELLAIGKFENKSSYMNGIFSDGKNRMGTQAKAILKTNLFNTNRFAVLDRDNLKELSDESNRSGEKQKLAGAQVIVSGTVTDFGRKTVGSGVFFGLFGRSKTQVAYSKVTVYVVDVHSSQILYSVQGAGEYQLKSSEILGTGSRAGYDSTLNGKVLNLAIVEAINNLIKGLEAGKWSPSKNK